MEELASEIACMNFKSTIIKLWVWRSPIEKGSHELLGFQTRAWWQPAAHVQYEVIIG
jgi:hypothetical protein